MFSSKFPKRYDSLLFCKSCGPEIVLAVLQIKTKTISRCKPYTTSEYSNKLSNCFGNLEENIDQSHIHLAVQVNNYEIVVIFFHTSHNFT